MEQLDLISEEMQDVRDEIDAFHVATEMDILEREREKVGGAGVGGRADGCREGGGENVLFSVQENGLGGDSGSSGHGLLEVDHLSHDFYDLVQP